MRRWLIKLLVFGNYHEVVIEAYDGYALGQALMNMSLAGGVYADLSNVISIERTL